MQTSLLNLFGWGSRTSAVPAEENFTSNQKHIPFIVGKRHFYLMKRAQAPTAASTGGYSGGYNKKPKDEAR